MENTHLQEMWGRRENDIKIFVSWLPLWEVITGYRVTPFKTGPVGQSSPHSPPSFPCFGNYSLLFALSQPTLPAPRLLILSVSLHPAHSSSNCPVWVCTYFLTVPGLNIITLQSPLQWMGGLWPPLTMLLELVSKVSVLAREGGLLFLPGQPSWGHSQISPSPKSAQQGERFLFLGIVRNKKLSYLSCQQLPKTEQPRERSKSWK